MLQEMAQAHATRRAKQNAVPEKIIVLESQAMCYFVLKKGVTVRMKLCALGLRTATAAENAPTVELYARCKSLKRSSRMPGGRTQHNQVFGVIHASREGS
jgi:hypothetical protein